jgi:hypothetical protein
MASLQELETALVNADKAGDAQSAAVLAQAVQQARAQVYVKPDGFGAKMNTVVDQAMRAPGLTARAGLRGVAGVVEALAEPIRLPLSAGLRAAGLRDRPIPTATDLATSAADVIGLPTPQTPMERIGSKGAELMAGAAVPISGASQITAVSPTAREVVRQFASQPGTQIASAAGAGTAGEYTKETGGNALSQFLASAAGGVGTGVAVNLGGQAIEAGKSAIRRLGAPPQGTTQIDATISSALGDPRAWELLPQHVRNQLRNDVAEAQRIGNLSPDAVRRLADYRLAEATPSRAGLTLDPVDITQQRNLAKFGANSRDQGVQAMARLENENARRLGTGVQDLAAGVTNDRYANSERALGALRTIDEARGAQVSELYRQARDSLGRAAPLDPAAATQNAGLALAEAQAQGSLPAAARRMLNDVATGRTPFNVDTKEMMVRRLYEMQSGASVNGSQRTAINIVRQALDDAPLLENHGLGPDALAAFRAARDAHRQRMAAREAAPALQAAADNVQPDAFFQRFVIGNDAGNVQALNAMRDELGPTSPAFQALRGQLVAYLKRAGGVDEQAGTFNSASFGNALDAIGKQKLSVFFSPEEVNRLQAIGRVARYEQVQPRGSAVNNSNTAATALGALERIANSSLATNIPLIGPMIGRGAENVVMRVRAGQASNVPQAIATPVPTAPNAPILPPALAALMAAPDNEEKRKNSRVDSILGTK